MLGACWLLARVLAYNLLGAGWVLAIFLMLACWVIAADGCLLMQELPLDFLPIYEAFAFIVELKA